MSHIRLLTSIAALASSFAPVASSAQEAAPPKAFPAPFYSWMHPDVHRAWSKGFKGQGATITVVDDFGQKDQADGDMRGKRFGILRNKWEFFFHGEWTSLQASLIAPSAKMIKRNFFIDDQLKLGSGFNVINVSYGYIGELKDINKLPKIEREIVNAAKTGSAVVVQAAGNFSDRYNYVLTPISQTPNKGEYDLISRNLKDAKSAIFVGALEFHGSRAKNQKAISAEYTNVAGADPDFQKRFVVVGVPRGEMGALEGTSLAAPVVSGYAAILYSKFQKATPTQITNQILTTARRDTILGYKVEIHGQGEASLSRALSPKRIQ